MGAESKQTPPGGAPVDELDDDAEQTTSGLALKPKAPVLDDDDDEAEEHTELQMDAELVARARHRLLFGRAKPGADGAKDAKPATPATPVAAPAVGPPRPSIPPPGALAAPGIPRRLPTPPPVSSPTAPPRPAPGAPGPLLSPNAAPGIARRLPTPPPGSIGPGAGPGPSLRAPTPSPVASPGRPRSSTIIGTGPSAGPGAAPRSPTPTPAPSSPVQAPAPLTTAADVSQSRRAMESQSGLVPAPARAPAVDSSDDDFIVSPQTTELPVPALGESTDLLGGIATLPSDAAITDENPVAPPLEVPAAFAPAPDGSVVDPNAAPADPNAMPAASAPPATGDAWSQPGSSVSRSGNTGVTNRKRAKRTPIEYAAIGIASLAVLWAIWLVLFYRR